jgi:hypothetical protein
MPKTSKKYVVRLTDEERQTLQQVVGKFKGVRRAILAASTTNMSGPI